MMARLEELTFEHRERARVRLRFSQGRGVAIRPADSIIDMTYDVLYWQTQDVGKRSPRPASLG